MRKYSIIILTYNREKYISNAIESVLNQTYKNIELIIIDNGSTDSSGKIADGYALKDERIRVKHLPKSPSGTSIGLGRNEGVRLAGGDYITFVDDDDTAEPTLIEFFDSLIDEYDADIAICGSSIGEDPGKMRPNQEYGEKLIMEPQEAIYHLFERQKYNAGFCGKCIRRRIMIDTPFREDCKYEDIWTSYRVFAKARRIVAYGIPQYNVIRHEANNSACTTDANLWTPDKFEEYFSAYRERTSWLIERFPDFSDYVKYSEWSFLISMYNKMESFNLQDCFAQKMYCKNILEEHIEELKNAKWTKEFEKEWIKKYF